MEKFAAEQDRNKCQQLWEISKYFNLFLICINMTDFKYVNTI